MALITAMPLLPMENFTSRERKFRTSGQVYVFFSILVQEEPESRLFKTTAVTLRAFCSRTPPT